MIKCFIDDREQNRGKKAYSYFKEKFPTKIAELLYGDYIFEDTETDINIAFEYKTIDDYIQSINDGRVFNQALNQSNYFQYHFVIIVGTDCEKSDVFDDIEMYRESPMTDEKFYGAYASLLEITSVIRVPNDDIAFMLMGKIAEKCCRDRPVVKRFKKSRGSPAFRLLKNNVDGIGFKKAELICETLGLETVEDVISLNVEKLCKVDGFGKKSSESLIRQLKAEFS